MNNESRIPLPESLRRSPVVAVLRARKATEYRPVIDALIGGGVTHIELTLSTAGVFDELPELLDEFGEAASIGVGTITTAAEAERAIAAGSSYLVTPAMNPEIIDAAIRTGTPVFPGGFSPTELLQGWRAGATAVKLFPASLAQPGYLADLRGPFPEIQVIPSGGITVDGAMEWLRAGACAVSIGGPLVQDAFRGGDLRELRTRARGLMACVHNAIEAEG